MIQALQPSEEHHPQPPLVEMETKGWPARINAVWGDALAKWTLRYQDSVAIATKNAEVRFTTTVGFDKDDETRHRFRWMDDGLHQSA